jgi:hypothetical protein
MTAQEDSVNKTEDLLNATNAHSAWDYWNLFLAEHGPDKLLRELRPTTHMIPRSPVDFPRWTRLQQVAEALCLPFPQEMSRCEHPGLVTDMLQLLYDYVDGDTMHEAYAKVAFRVYLTLAQDQAVRGGLNHEGSW